jgi:hypothetical protein
MIIMIIPYYIIHGMFTIPSHGWFMTWFYPQKTRVLGIFIVGIFTASDRACLPTSTGASTTGISGDPIEPYSNGETDVLKHGILRVFYTKKI